MFLDSFINKIDNYSDNDDLNISNDSTKINNNKYYNDSETKPNSSDSPSEKEEDPDNNEEKKKNLIKIEKTENFAHIQVCNHLWRCLLRCRPGVRQESGARAKEKGSEISSRHSQGSGGYRPHGERERNPQQCAYWNRSIGEVVQATFQSCVECYPHRHPWLLLDRQRSA